MEANFSKRIFSFIIIVLFFLSCGRGGRIIATFDGGKIRQQDYIQLYLRSTENKPDQMPDEKNIKKLVSRIALEKISLLEAKSTALEKDSLFADRFKDTLMKFFFQKYLEKEIAARVVSDSLVKMFYKHFSPQYKIEYLLCPVAKRSDTIAVNVCKNTMTSIYKRLKTGEKFNDIMKQFSGNKESNVKTGDFGWVIPESIRYPQIKEAIENLDLYQYSAPVSAEKGYYLLYKSEKREVPVPAFAEVERKIRASLIAAYRDEVEKVMKLRFDSLKEAYHYQVNNQFIDEIEKKVTKPVSKDAVVYNFEDLSSQEMNGIVATYDGGVIRVKELFEKRHKRPDNMWEFRDRLEIIARLHLFGKHAFDLGYKKVPEYQSEIHKIHDGILRGILYRYNIDDVVAAQIKADKITDVKERISLKRTTEAKFKNELKQKYHFTFVTKNFRDTIKKAKKEKENQTAKKTK